MHLIPFFLSVSQDIFLVCEMSFLILQICKSNINIFILKISFCKSNINIYIMVNMVATLLTHQTLTPDFIRQVSVTEAPPLRVSERRIPAVR